MSNGIFGNMFDFNGDGDLDIFEQATEFDFLQKMMEDDEKSDSHEDDDSDDGWRDQYYGDEIGLDPGRLRNRGRIPGSCCRKGSLDIRYS